jgi:hypothetical protein
VTNRAGLSSAAEPGPFADLIADAADVQRVLHLAGATVKLPDQRVLVLPDAVIPDRALAVVAGLDTYGD